MGKMSEFVRPILFTIGGVFALQVPLFIAFLTLAEWKGLDKNSLTSTVTGGQTLLFSPLNISSPSLTVEIETSSHRDCSAAADEAAPEKITSLAAFKPLSFANYPFVLFSVYRLALNSFYVHGITSVIVRGYENEQPVYRCEWVPGGGNSNSSDPGGAGENSHDNEERGIVTEAQMLYVRFDENRMAYVPAIVNCTFNESVGADGEGGILRLHLSRGPSFWEPHFAVEDVFKENAGDVNEKSRSQLMQLELELDGTDNLSSVAMAEAWPYKYAFCGPPLYGTTHNTNWIPKWLAYHHYLWEGKAHFYFYVVEGLDIAARHVLEPWIEAGLLTIVTAEGGEAYPSWYRNQLLFINDCIYRTKFTARWTFFHDLDELLFVPSPNTLAGLLEEHGEKPWMTFGNLPFSTHHCRTTQKTPLQSEQQEQSSDEEEWQLERLVWRNKQPECRHQDEDPWMCIAAPGRRKYVVNPRKVILSGVHRVAVPKEGGVNFNASIARVHHFHGVTNPHMTVCNHLVNMSAESDQPDPRSHELDEAMASIMAQVRTFAGHLLRSPLQLH